MKKKRFFLIIAILAVIFFVTYSPARQGARRIILKSSGRVLSTLSNSGNKIGGWFSFAGNISNLNNTNNELVQKITSLEVDKSKIIELEHENTLLKNELGFIENNKEEILCPAKIIGREPTSFMDHVIVDKGEADGIKKGMAAISAGVLVGQVSEVYGNKSKIILSFMALRGDGQHAGRAAGQAFPPCWHPSHTQDRACFLLVR